MKFSVATILALGVVPAYSLSYLDQLSGAKAPSFSSAAPAPAAEPPFFFTNGHRDEPAETPDFFFATGSSDPPATTSTGYLSALGAGPANSISGAGMASYLDSLPKNAVASSGGAGLASYTDMLSGTRNAAASTGGAGLASYTDMLSGGARPAPVAQPQAAAPVAAAPVAASSAAPVASGNYMDALAASASGAPSGAGMTSYLDALPKAPPTRGGAGIASYKDSLPVTNTAVGTGSGMTSYTDNLSGGRISSGKSFAPFSASKQSGGGAFGVDKGRFEFSIHADPAMIAQIEAAQGRRVRLSGRASFN